jgi:hypothetical protein
MKTSIHRLAFAAAAATIAVAAQAANVTIEPDNYTGVVSGVAPGATLSTFRYNGAGGWTRHRVYSIDVGNWAATGTRVFGHTKVAPTETIHHWDYLQGAYSCEHDGFCSSNFYTFRVDFDTPTSRVEVLTTVRGEMAQDGFEFWAFDSNGDRIQRCIVAPISNATLTTGVMPPPRYYAPFPLVGQPCGAVLLKKNCPPLPATYPGDCDYVVSMNTRRVQSDIAYVMFAGRLEGNSVANVDKLTYWLP